MEAKNVDLIEAGSRIVGTRVSEGPLGDGGRVVSGHGVQWDRRNDF